MWHDEASERVGEICPKSIGEGDHPVESKLTPKTTEHSSPYPAMPMHYRTQSHHSSNQKMFISLSGSNDGPLFDIFSSSNLDLSHTRHPLGCAQHIWAIPPPTTSTRARTLTSLTLLMKAAAVAIPIRILFRMY